MPEFKWTAARSTLEGFGGNSIVLHVDKTGLPFYDALRLYGAIDLYLGLREDLSIHDLGNRWKVCGRSRGQRLEGRDVSAFKAVCTKKTTNPEKFCGMLRKAIVSGGRIPRDKDLEELAPTENGRALDPVLQSGIRGLSAAEYESMNSTSKSACKAKIWLSEAVLAYAGLRRTEALGDIQFLPIFEGRIDLGKIVSPLRAWLSVPNPLCAQALMLLSLKTALWSEGYAERLSAVAYAKKTQKTSFNYSGLIRIDSTAIGRIDDGHFCERLHRVFRHMTATSWKKDKATSIAPHTLAVAEWLMQPLPRTLTQMITAQEFLRKIGNMPFLLTRDNVRKVFEMSHPQPKLDHEAVRLLAKATSSAIYALRRKGNQKDKWKQHWYDEVVALRNSPTKEAFLHRVLTLVEQGRREGSWIDSFNPESLLNSMGEGRAEFERFRDCFRMYLILESAPKRETIQEEEGDMAESDESDNEEEGAE